MNRPIFIIGDLFIKEFDDAWANKWSIKATRMSVNLAKDMSTEEVGYGRIYRLCEFLWKLKVWTP